MFQCAVRELKEGDILARPIVGRNGITILEQGATLSSRYIKRLHELGIGNVYLENGAVRSGSTDTLTHLQSERHKTASPFLYNELINRLDADKYNPQGADSVKERVFKRKFKKTIGDILAHPGVVALLEQLYEFDEYIFEHSVNVSILSAMIGDECAFGGGKMLELVLGSLLFDIGMTRMPRDLVQSSKRLAALQRAKLQEHASVGYSQLRKLEGMPHSSAIISLCHHERFDGSGYPLGKQGISIPEYARIVAIADSYNALVSPRRYRPSYRADDAVELLYASGNYYFDAELVNLFLKRMKAFPVSSVLTLSSGQTGIVKSYSSSIVHRPVVQIIREANGSAVTTPYELDLASSSNITVLHATS